MKKELVLVVFMSVLLSISYATADSNCSEQQMLANFVKTGNPALDLQNFAGINNLSLEQAKEILKRNFSAPQISKEDYFNKIAMTKNPDEDLRRYALDNNLSIDEAKIILVQMFGEPQKP